MGLDRWIVEDILGLSVDVSLDSMGLVAQENVDSVEVLAEEDAFKAVPGRYVGTPLVETGIL